VLVPSGAGSDGCFEASWAITETGRYPEASFRRFGLAPPGVGSSSEVPAIGRLISDSRRKAWLSVVPDWFTVLWVIQLEKKIWLRRYPLLQGKLPADLANHGF
jgi:hypothetical protein